jgi:hypothetical protein
MKLACLHLLERSHHAFMLLCLICSEISHLSNQQRADYISNVYMISSMKWKQLTLDHIRDTLKFDRCDSYINKTNAPDQQLQRKCFNPQ